MTGELYLKGVIRPVPSGEAGKKVDGPKNATRNAAEQEAYHNYRTVYAPPVGFSKSIWALTLTFIVLDYPDPSC